MKILFGIIYTLILLIFFVISLPVYLYRSFVIFLAKWFRPDLGDILNGQSALFVGDHLESSRPPRSNVLVCMTFDGPLTYEEVKTQILKNWLQDNKDVTRNLTLEKFRQYPVNWMGFTFWRQLCEDAETLASIHVKKLFGSHVSVTNDLLDEAMEQLLNSRLPKNKSPWEVHVIENFGEDLKYRGTSESRKSTQQSIIIVKIHHCLADGYGLFTAITRGLFKAPAYGTSKIVEISKPQQSWWQIFSFWVTFPVVAFLEFSDTLSHTFHRSPWKIPDDQKQWQQVFAKSRPIALKDVKEIKNRFRVTFTAVILSAISAALAKSHIGRGQTKTTDNSVLCMSSLAVRNRQEKKTLSNHMTGSLYHLPLGPFNSPTERLFAVDQMLQKNKQSVMPLISQHFSRLLGSHLNPIKCLLVKNKIIPVALTNFAGAPATLSFDQGKTKWIQAEGIFGGFEGNTGLVVGSLSHGDDIRLHICAERGLMLREEAQVFVACINEEIELLRRELIKLVS